MIVYDEYYELRTSLLGAASEGHREVSLFTPVKLRREGVWARTVVNERSYKVYDDDYEYKKLKSFYNDKIKNQRKLRLLRKNQKNWGLKVIK